MIGVDTNILVRSYLQDHEKEAKVAQKLLLEAAKKDELFISSYAILEFVWVLKTTKFTRTEIYNAVMTLADSAGVTIGNREVVLNAISKFKSGKADFGDYMILCEGEENKVYKIETFDKTFKKELGA